MKIYSIDVKEKEMLVGLTFEDLGQIMEELYTLGGAAVHEESLQRAPAHQTLLQYLKLSKVIRVIKPEIQVHGAPDLDKEPDVG